MKSLPKISYFTLFKSNLLWKENNNLYFYGPDWENYDTYAYCVRTYYDELCWKTIDDIYEIMHGNLCPYALRKLSKNLLEVRFGPSTPWTTMDIQLIFKGGWTDYCDNGREQPIDEILNYIQEVLFENLSEEEYNEMYNESLLEEN